MTVLAAVLGAGFAAAALAAISGATPTRTDPSNTGLARSIRHTFEGRLTAMDRQQLAVACAVAIAAFVVTRWPIAIPAGAAAGWMIPLPAKRTRRAQLEARTEAIAQWCEMLRDSAGTGRGLEGMLVATASSAPEAVRGPAQDLARRLDHQNLDVALNHLADDLAHPMGDLMVTALRLASTAGSKRVQDVLDQLAISAHREAAMRRRVEVARARPRSATRLVAIIVASFVGGLTIFAGDYLAPYRSAIGQVILIVIGIYWALGFWWMTRLGQLPEVERFAAKANPARDDYADLAHQRWATREQAS